MRRLVQRRIGGGYRLLHGLRGRVDGVALPDEWAKFAPLSDEPIAIDGAQIDTGLEDWLRTWAEQIG